MYHIPSRAQVSSFSSPTTLHPLQGGLDHMSHAESRSCHLVLVSADLHPLQGGFNQAEVSLSHLVFVIATLHPLQSAFDHGSILRRWF